MSMKRTRVLVVDNSVVTRRVLTDGISADETLEVVGGAATGRIALAKLTQLSPDVITLDTELPDMSGLELLHTIRRTHPTLPIIVFGFLDALASSTIAALIAGASEFIDKPTGTDGVAAIALRVREQVVPRIKACRADGTPVADDDDSWLPASPGLVKSGDSLVSLVAIGASTGGPNALARILAHLGPQFPVPIVIVQHMPPAFTRMLAERLSAECNMKVVEAQAGDVLQPGQAWIAPGDNHLVLGGERARVRLGLHQGPPENSCRPSVDVLFRSAAKLYGDALLGVVLTGMGRDGLRGSEYVRAVGGSVIVQDEASSVVWGMPRFIVRAGLANAIVPLAGMANEILRRVSQHRRLGANVQPQGTSW
jgi:two-component system chemotaxis response regulator CheB